MRPVLHVLTLLVLTGCALSDRERIDNGPTLAELEPVSLVLEAEPLPAVSLDELADLYAQALTHQQDPAVVTQVQHRLADIDMLSGEAALAAAAGQERMLDAAIAAYRGLLADNPDYQRRDTILYQLSRAYDLKGDAALAARMLETLRSTTPDSGFVAEASFRLGERHFAHARYAAAEADYLRVIEAGAANEFYIRSLYMAGWSRFKQSQFRSSIDAFTASLDEMLAAREGYATLNRADQELVDDSMRVLALAFDNLQGVDSIAAVFDSLGERDYTHRVYEALAALYLEKERFADSAGVYQAYAQRYPASERAHDYQLRTIEAYEQGGFPDRILAAKRAYVERFSLLGDYWAEAAQPVREQIAQHQVAYLGELASHFHAQAQQATGDANRDLYGAAAAYYRQFLEEFPAHPEVPSTAFHLAESLYESGAHEQALAAYEGMAYSYPDHEQAADAGYMTLQIHRSLSDQAGSQGADAQQVRATVAAGLRFARQFEDDPRAPRVLQDAADQLLAIGAYADAADVAQLLLASLGDDPGTLGVSAQLVLGHSLFELERWAPAHAAYDMALAQMAASDERREPTRQRVAAALYRQAEQRVTDGEALAAAALFEDATQMAPDSGIGVTALYDAAVNYREAGELERSTQLFLRFRQQHPDHALTAALPATLVANYEALEDWQGAAGELDRIAGAHEDPETRRQSLALAATYYDRAGRTELAIDRLRQYAHRWTEPLEPRMEAMHRLAGLYADGGERDKRFFWLEKIESAHTADAGARVDFLAASACSTRADALFEGFSKVALTLPLKRSLAGKRSAMEKVLTAQSRCAAYGVEQFTTRSAHRIGQVYARFSEALLASQRPDSLDALALDQYNLMLEEQAFPFEEKAIEVYQANIARCTREGVYDEWVRASYDALATLVPARYHKPEQLALDAAVEQTAEHNARTQRRLTRLNEEGIALRRDGQFDAARAAYRRALEVADDDAVTHRNLGILYELYLGQQDRALAHYARYSALTGSADRVVQGWIAQLERSGVTLAGEP